MAKSLSFALEKYIAEAGIDGDLTFYAQWKEVKEEIKEENETTNTNNSINNNIVNNVIINNSINNNKVTIDNPQTGDNIVLFTVISLIAAVGIAVIIKVKEYVK